MAAGREAYEAAWAAAVRRAAAEGGERPERVATVAFREGFQAGYLKGQADQMPELEVARRGAEFHRQCMEEMAMALAEAERRNMQLRAGPLHAPAHGPAGLSPPPGPAAFAPAEARPAPAGSDLRGNLLVDSERFKELMGIRWLHEDPPGSRSRSPSPPSPREAAPERAGGGGGGGARRSGGTQAGPEMVDEGSQARRNSIMQHLKATHPGGFVGAGGAAQAGPPRETVGTQGALEMVDEASQAHRRSIMQPLERQGAGPGVSGGGRAAPPPPPQRAIKTIVLSPRSVSAESPVSPDYQSIYPADPAAPKYYENGFSPDWKPDVQMTNAQPYQAGGGTSPLAFTRYSPPERGRAQRDATPLPSQYSPPPGRPAAEARHASGKPGFQRAAPRRPSPRVSPRPSPVVSPRVRKKKPQLHRVRSPDAREGGEGGGAPQPSPPMVVKRIQRSISPSSSSEGGPPAAPCGTPGAAPLTVRKVQHRAKEGAAPAGKAAPPAENQVLKMIEDRRRNSELGQQPAGLVDSYVDDLKLAASRMQRQDEQHTENVRHLLDGIVYTFDTRVPGLFGRTSDATHINDLADYGRF